MTTKCQGWCKKANPITHIGNKGYVYCRSCAVTRRQSHIERVRTMRAWELKMLNDSKPLPSYEPTHTPIAA